MTLQFSVSYRNQRLQSLETTVSTAPQLVIRTGAPPANCAAAATGTVLATMALPSDWMAAPSGGSAAKSGTWSDSAADATGTAGHFRINDTAGTNCHLQGTVGVSAADLIVDSVAFTAGQAFTIITFTLSAGGA